MPGRKQVLQQVSPPERLPALAGGGCGDHLVLGVEEGDLTQCAVDRHRRILLLRRAKREATHQRLPGGGADPDHRRVIALGGVGTVEVRVYGRDIGKRFGAGHMQPCRNRVRQGVRGHTVHNIRAVQAALARPAGPFEVPLGPQPQALGAQAQDIADFAGCDGLTDRGQGEGSQALETHLNQLPRGLGCSRHLLELRQGGHGGLFHIHVRACCKRGQCQGRVCLDGRGQDDDVGGRPRGKELIEGGEDSDGAAQAAVLRRMWIGHGHELDGAGGLQPGQITKVLFAEAVYTHQGYPRPGSRSRRRARSHV